MALAVLAPIAALYRSHSSTAQAVTSDPVIAAAGDNACGANSQGATCRELATSDLLIDMQNTDRLDAILPLGDVQYECGEIENFNLQNNSNPPRGYGRSWGRPSLKAITRSVVGNHEYRTDPVDCLPQTTGAPGYFTYFGPAASPLDTNCGAGCKGYYSYDLGAWHIITLNSNCGQAPGGCGATSPQATWLRNDLASTTKECVMAAFHHPRYSSSIRATTSTQALWAALYNAHADVVLTGHEHSYERFDQLGLGTATSTEPTLDPEGIRLFVVGTGGRNLSSFQGPIRTGSQVRNSTTFGVLRMVLHAAGYDWQFVPTPGQFFTDSGSTACHTASGPPPDTQPPSTPANLAATAPSSGQVGLTWSASTDNVGVSGYDVLRDGAPLATTTGTGTGYTDTSVIAGTTYAYQTRARDGAGLTSGLSNTATVTTPAALPPGTFAPVADARVQESVPDTNFGASFLRIDGGSDPDVESYLRFDVTGLPAGETVQRATLRLFSTNGSGNGPAIYDTSDGWGESTINWSNRPARSATATDDKVAIATNTWVEYDVTPLVTGNGLQSFALVGVSSDGTDFNSREAGTNRPELIVATG